MADLDADLASHWSIGGIAMQHDLAGPDASFITGSIIEVNGGFTA